MNLIKEFDFTTWNPKITQAKSKQVIEALEGGFAICLPQLPFTLNEDEKKFLSQRWSDQKSKNISFIRGLYAARRSKPSARNQ